MSCRVIKNKRAWHIITVKGDYRGEAVLVGCDPPRNGPQDCYLSVWAEDTNGRAAHFSVSGRKTLRALARAILRSTKP